MTKMKHIEETIFRNEPIKLKNLLKNVDSNLTNNFT